jgi:hypothetical protein
MKTSRSVKIHKVLLTLSLLIATMAFAQRPIDGLVLGMSEPELLAEFTSAHRNSKPIHGPHGLRGLWSLKNTLTSGLPFESTFFLKDKRVQRIEQRWASVDIACKSQAFFDVLVSDMTTKYGAGLLSSDRAASQEIRLSAVWEAGEYDVFVHQSNAVGSCSILVVYANHVAKDASEL